MSLSRDTDRELLDLISTLTDERKILQLRDAVDEFGPERVVRLVRDGFVVVFRSPRLSEFSSLPPDEAVELAQLGSVPTDYRITQAPGALALESAPNLVFDYVADTPEAIAEVRARHGLA